MINRKRTKTVHAGTVKIGGKHSIVIQSMTKTATTDIAGCVRQVKSLIKAGAGLVRIAVPAKTDTEAFAKIVQKSNIPLIADVHFSADRAVEAIQAGAAKIRLNPGNIKQTADINRIIDSAKAHKIAVRVGVNEASIRDLKTDIPPEKRVALMLREMKKYIRIFEKRGFDNLVLSAKSADIRRTIEINRKLSENFNYPLHIGLTHAGLPEDAEIPSAITLGSLLADGIGDTIRISMAGNPVKEIEAAKKLLTVLNLRERRSPELIVCPTCGRAQMDVVKLARKVKKAIKEIHKPLRIAVMGCVVNGPGEAADADIAICAGKNKAYLYKDGKKSAVLAEDKIIKSLKQYLEKQCG
jgi:(E)-4-hydroxy-3-methylbut-2-enyl-diphosphate synthase